MQKRLELILTPALSDLYNFENKTVVVIDVLRATSTIVAALDSGFHSVITVKELDLARSLKNENTLVAGERNGEKIPDFDLGNSPLEILNHPNKTSNLVLTSTNGTKCVEMSVERKAAKVLCGALTNVKALANYLQQDTNDLIVLCAAWKNLINMEDTFMAGKLISQLSDYKIICDSAQMAKHLALNQKDDLKFLSNANHFHRLKKLGNEDDVEFCLNAKQVDVVPELVEYSEGISVFKNKFKPI